MDQRISRGRIEGVSLIEVMVAVLVFSVGLLGIAMLQMRGAQFTKESGSRTSAIILARSLAESMRANPKGAIPATGDSDYLYDGSTAYTEADCASTTLDTPAAVAKRDLACWQLALKKSLPAPAAGHSVATVTRDDNLGTLVIKVSWAGVADDENTDSTQTYSFSYLQ
ncbi:type IV pilus modification protein PilV [Lutibacter sp. SG786]|uniref:type IV pilus modification protein PilV n=1 Tax=Luteibacter sp. SG786 TaxID=2587130 RepID=UPI001422E559|nr:type IV pilus assembly protein PilV [Luteibacter sp. SG786]